jgi:hypothetical protein
VPCALAAENQSLLTIRDVSNEDSCVTAFARHNDALDSAKTANCSESGNPLLSKVGVVKRAGTGRLKEWLGRLGM